MIKDFRALQVLLSTNFLNTNKDKKINEKKKNIYIYIYIYIYMHTHIYTHRIIPYDLPMSLNPLKLPQYQLGSNADC